MSVMDGMTRVRSHDGSRLVAQCLLCDVEFELLDPCEVPAGLQAFDDSHPGGAGAAHVPGVPTGWRRCVVGDEGSS